MPDPPSTRRQAAASPVVQARGLVKCFGALRAVDAIDFDIPAGRCFGFLGPNGAGKTTTLKMLGKRIKWLILPLHESETDR
ncbi:ATP-binding cassette domain-containing protein, partial [Guyparkeria sp. SCN-R1]